MASKIDPMQSRINLRGTRHISGGGITILPNSAKYFVRLEVVVPSIELTKDLEITRPRRRNPEVILFSVDQNLPEDKIITAIFEQNEALKGASLNM